MDGNRTSLVKIVWRGLRLVPLFFLAIFFFYPLVSIFALSLAPEGQLDLGSLRQLVASSYYVDVLLFTVGQATASTLLTMLLALPTAYIFVRYTFPGKPVLLSLATLAFVLPTVVVAAAFSALIGPNGIVNDLLRHWFQLEAPPVQLEGTLAIILIVHVFYNYAVALRMIVSFWSNQSPRIEEAARVLGAHGWRLWWYVRLPILRPALMAAAALVFVFTFTSFGVIIILGGPRFATLEVEIYQQAVSLFNLPVAAGLSLVQIGLMFVLMLVYTRLQNRMPVDLRGVQHVARPPKSVVERLIVIFTLALTLILLITPLLALVIRSFAGADGFTTAYYSALTENPRSSVLFVPPAQAVTNSVMFAVATTIMASVLGLLTVYLLSQGRSRWLDPVFMLPLATSAVTLGFGFIIALDEPPLNLRTSPVLIPVAHTLVALPFVIRSVMPVLNSIGANMREAAGVLGASPFRVWRWIDLPIISRGLLVGATFAFTISMGEFGASLFVARPNTPTMPVVIFRLLGQPGALNVGQAMAMSVLLLVVCAVSFLLIERVRTTSIGEF